ncbi:MAG: hypothetical protein KAY65_08365, partial [Planctomycetes bacterium]|nr:hypothetical protein [Planctomycetota bacterium]
MVATRNLINAMTKNVSDRQKNSAAIMLCAMNFLPDSSGFPLISCCAMKYGPITNTCIAAAIPTVEKASIILDLHLKNAFVNLYIEGQSISLFFFLYRPTASL